MLDVKPSARPRSLGRRRLAGAVVATILGVGTALSTGSPAQAAGPDGPWNLMLRSKQPDTRSMYFRNWTTGARPLCWRSDPLQWRSTGQQVKAYQVVSALGYTNRKCQLDGKLTGGVTSLLLLPQTTGRTNYWLEFL